MTATVTKPAIILRDQLAAIPKKVDTGLVEILFSGNGSTPSFTLPAGLKPYAIYVDGLRKLPAGISSITVDINIYTINFAAAPASGTNNIQVDAVRVL